MKVNNTKPYNIHAKYDKNQIKKDLAQDFKNAAENLIANDKTKTSDMLEVLKKLYTMSNGKYHDIMKEDGYRQNNWLNHDENNLKVFMKYVKEFGVTWMCLETDMSAKEKTSTNATGKPHDIGSCFGIIYVLMIYMNNPKVISAITQKLTEAGINRTLHHDLLILANCNTQYLKDEYPSFKATCDTIRYLITITESGLFQSELKELETISNAQGTNEDYKNLQAICKRLAGEIDDNNAKSNTIKKCVGIIRGMAQMVQLGLENEQSNLVKFPTFNTPVESLIKHYVQKNRENANLNMRICSSDNKHTHEISIFITDNVIQYFDPNVGIELAYKIPSNIAINQLEQEKFIQIIAKKMTEIINKRYSNLYTEFYIDKNQYTLDKAIAQHNSDKNSQKFDGNLLNGSPHGEGTLTKGNGTTMIGNFEHGILNGEGKIIYPNGVTESGSFINGRLNGEGARTFQDGYKEQGSFVNGNLSHNGKITYPNGMIVEGNFVDNKLHGKGKITYQNGMIIEGDFVDSKLHGNAITIYNSLRENESNYGDVYIGTYENGELVGTGTVNDRHGNRKRDFFIGTNAAVYEGEIVGDKLNGMGRITYYLNDRSEEGYFSEGKKYGLWTYFEKRDGQYFTYTANFDNGKQIGDYSAKQLVPKK